MLNNLKYLWYVAAALLVALTHYLAYNYGSMAARETCTAAMQAYQKQVHEKITSIESTLLGMAELGAQREQLLAQDIQEILAGVKKKPVTIIKNGQCNPQATFVEGIDKAISRANSK